MTRAPAAKRSPKQLTERQRAQLERFAKLLSDRMRESNVSAPKLAKYTDLRTETIRSYMRGLNRPTKVSMRRLCMLFGEDLAEPFHGTELAGPDEDAINVVHLPNGLAILAARTLVTESTLAKVLELLREHRVAESAPALYSRR